MPSTRSCRVLAGLILLAIVTFAPGLAHATWALDGSIVVGVSGTPASPVILPGGSAGFFAAWVDGRTGYNTDVRTARFEPNAVLASGWVAGGNSVTNVTCRKYSLVGAPDGAGGALFAWSDDRCVSTRRIYISRMTASGTWAPGWAQNGTWLAPTGANQFTPAIVAEASGGSYVAWQDHRGTVPLIYLQRVTANGAPVSGWPATGLVVCPTSGTQSLPQLALDGAGGVFVAWIDRRSGGDDLYLQRITGTGTIASGWAATGKAVCTAAGDQSELSLVSDGGTGAFLAWRDPRTGDANIFSSRITATSSTASGWTSGGTAVTTALGEQSGVRIAPDGALGLLLTWQDHRGASWDVYAMRLATNAAAVAGWTSGGVAIAATAQDELAPSLVADGAGGGFVAWQKGVAGAFDVMGTRVAGNGAPAAGWTANGMSVSAASGDQIAPLVTFVGGDGYALWTDLRAGPSAPALYAQRLTATGPQVVQSSALTSLCHDGQTFLTWTPPPDTGWTHRIYRRSSPILTTADLDLSTLLGSVGDSAATDHRLSSVSGGVFTFRTDSAAAPLAPDQGLFVVTAPATRTSWYAVTSQARGASEDRRVTPGVNALTSAVMESLAVPRPVFQRTRTCGAVTQYVYTLWTWNTDTPTFPAMSNRPSQPFDCGVTKGALNGPAFVRPHQRGGVFTEQCQASGSLSEWVLGLDDYTRNQDICTYYYGYHPDYDEASDANTAPTSGQVVDYTNRRMLHTIDWWRRTFPFDTTRHYAFGYSLGGYYSMQLALRHPERIAAAMSVVGKVDFSFEAEPVSNCMFNSGMPSREALSRMWGTTATNLATTNGPPVYSMVSDSALATMSAGPGVSWVANFAGRNDVVVGWAEKLPFYAALEATRGGGVQFWDLRDHIGTIPAGFAPMLDLTYLYRFRSDLSWPAFSHCTANSDPGNGWSSSGDTLGTINGFMEWDPAVADSATVWGVTLSTRALTTRWGVRAAPESLTVDVTPRRLQRFRPTPGLQVTWKAVRVSDGAQVQAGTVPVDALGRITIPGVKTYRTGTRLSLASTASWLDAGGPPSATTDIAFTGAPNPVRGRVTFALRWPRSGEARLELFDMLGRRARVLASGPVRAGAWSASVDLGSLAPGVYQLRASQGEHSATRRVVRLR